MRNGFAFWIGSMAFTSAMLAPPPSSAAAPLPIDQGKEWTASAQKDFYSRDQGSRIMPLSWIAALKQPNGKPFMADSLSRYGYLPKGESPPGLRSLYRCSGSNARRLA